MSETTDADLPSTPTPQRASRWEDFIDIFYAPSDVYARREHSGFGIPMLVVTLLIGGIALANAGAMQPLMDAEFDRAMAQAAAKNPIPPEMQSQMRSFSAMGAKIGGFIFPPIAIFFTALFLWVAGKFVDAKQTLGAAVMVSAYAYVPKILEQVLAGVQALLLSPESMNGRFKISLGLGRFFDPDVTSPLLLNFIGRIDVFTIWVTILLAIGLSITGKVSRRNAAIAAVIVWFLGAIPTLLQSARA